jgi:autotransporter-associated beta strand protein
VQGAGNGVLSGSITGSPAMVLTKSGTGTWTLSGTNTYTGATTVNAGKLVLSSAQPTTSAITVNANATLGVTVSATNSLSPTTLTFGTSTTLEISGLTSTTLAPIQAGAIVRNGTTTVRILGGAFVAGQSYPLIQYTTASGAGSLVLGTLPAGMSATLNTNGNGVVLNVSAVGASIASIWVGGVNGIWDTGTLNWSYAGAAATYVDGGAVRFDDTALGSANITLPAAVAPGAILFANNTKAYTLGGGPLAGSASLTKNGSGSVTLAGSNTYGGGTYVNAGVVNVSDSAANAHNINSALGSGDVAVAAGASLGFSGPDYHTCSNAITLNGAGNTTSAGALRFINSNWTLAGALTLAGNAQVTGAQNTMSGMIDLGNNTLTVSKNSGVSDTWSAIISGPGGLTLAGADATTKLALTGGNTYSGPTTVHAGILSVGFIGNGGVASGSLGSASSAAANLVLGGGTLQYTGTTATSDRDFTLESGTTSTIEVTSASTTLTLTGSAAATSGALTKAGAGTLVLAANNLYGGPTTLSAGTLALGTSGSLASSSGINVASGATFDVSAAPFVLGAAQTLQGTGTVLGAATIHGTLSPGAGSGLGGTLTFNGPLTLAAGSTTVMEIGRNGTALTSARIQSSGSLIFGGTLVIADVGDSLLQAGDTWQFFSAPGMGGSFDHIVAPPGYTFDPSQLAYGRIVVTSAPPPPGFTTFNAGSGNVTLAWPANYIGWSVQSSTTLAENDWSDLLGSDALTQLSFPMDPAVTREFYRLRSPDPADYAYDPLAKGAGLDIDTVWSGVSVGFAFLTTGDVQIAAYYNAARRLVLAARNLDSAQWYYQTTSETFAGWDAHNWIAMSADPEGYVHVSANMHAVPMIYFRSAQPITDAAQFQAAGFMQRLSPLWNAANEAQTTYPSWFTGPNGEFLFSYRNHTSSFAGSWYLLKYNTGTKAYPQPTGTNALFTWTGNYSVYTDFKVHGGFMHCLYNWRGGWDASTNYRLSYLRSADMVNWTDAFGRAVTLPVGPSATLPVIDDVPQNGGLLNGQPKLSFDRDGVPLVAYHKYDSGGKSQVYAARPVPGSLSWKIVQLTNSSWTYNFSGVGSLPPGGSVNNDFVADDPLDGLATLSISMKHADGVSEPDSGYYMLDETTLNNVLGTVSNSGSYASANTPAANTSYVDSSVVSNTYVAPVTGATMGIRRLSSSEPGFAGMHYYLRWETLPSDNSDRPKKDASGNVINPTPSLLQVYRTQAEFGDSLMSTGGTFYGRMFKPATARLFGAMTRTINPAAAFGNALTSPTAGTANFAQWSFCVPTAGDYALGGAAYTNAADADGFWVQVDSGPLIDWRVSGRWDYQPVTAGPGKGLARFDLTAGTHKLRLYARDATTKLAYLWLNQPGTAKTPSLLPLDYSGFTLAVDGNAVSGYSLNSAAGSDPTDSTAHYQIPVASSGNHLLLGRTRAPDLTSDSFYLALNGGTPRLWTLPVSGSAWAWAPFGTTLSLSAGILDLDVSGRQGGAELDCFMLLKVP